MSKLPKDVPVILPFMGEFGSLVHKHVPGVYGAPRPVIICHEEGYEALYPNAIERWTYSRPPADQRKAGGNIHQKRYFAQIREHFGEGQTYIDDKAPMKWRSKYFVPEHSRDYGLDFDVLLFARRQEYSHDRNFPYWLELQRGLQAKGIRCLVAGQPDSTAKLDCPAIWDLIDKPSQILDATIWAINKAKMRIGSATGTSLLSLLCGQNIIVIISETGHDAQGSKMTFPAGYYYQIDHKRVGYRISSHWLEWERALDEILSWYGNIDQFHADCRNWIKKIHDNLAIPDPDQKWRNLR